MEKQMNSTKLVYLFSVEFYRKILQLLQAIEHLYSNERKTNMQIIKIQDPFSLLPPKIKIFLSQSSKSINKTRIHCIARTHKHNINLSLIFFSEPGFRGKLFLAEDFVGSVRFRYNQRRLRPINEIWCNSGEWTPQSRMKSQV